MGIGKVTMNIRLKKAALNEAEFILKMQKEAFAELLEKYQDYETNPANESIDKITTRLNQNFTYYYLIDVDNEIVGVIRIVDGKDGNRKRISPIIVLPRYQNMGIAQKAIQAVEEIHGNDNWKLETILQEEKNCHLYEKMGYKKTGKTEKINEKLTLVFYEKA